MSNYSGINFLREQVRLQEETLVSDRRLAFITSIILGGFLAVLTAIILYRVFLGSQITKLEDAISKEKSTLASYKQVHQEYQEVSTQLGYLKTVLNSRTKKWDAIADLYSILPTETTMRTVNLSGITKTIEFSIRLPTTQVMEQALRILQSEETKSRGYGVEFSGFSRAKDGSFQIAVKLSVPDLNKRETKAAL